MRHRLKVPLVAVLLAGCGSSSGSGGHPPTPSTTGAHGHVPTPAGGNSGGVAVLPTHTPVPAAQYTALLKGTVTDVQKKSPLAGALVSVNGGAKMTRTNAFGEYSISYPAGAPVPVQVTFGGYTQGLGTGVIKAHRTVIVNFRLERVVPGKVSVPPPPVMFGVP